MILDRRRLILNATAAMVALPIFSRSFTSAAAALDQIPDAPTTRWHPMVEAILDRARNVSGRRISERGLIEDTIKRRAEAAAYKIAPVKWLETSADAHAYLSHQGLEVLLEADVARFWKFDNSKVLQRGFDYPESAYDAQSEAEEFFRVEERENEVSAPKQRAKAHAIASNISAQNVFYTRAVSSQIGWLETVIARAAAYSIYQIELLLSLGVSEDAAEIRRLLNVFEAYEHGLLATWETAQEFVCVACPHPAS
jgi:hypothetical protein